MQDNDTLRRFLFEDLAIRGEWVNLTESWQTAKQHHNYPNNVMQQLGEALAAATLLSATIKFDGNLILQAQGDGDLNSLTVQCTHNRDIRGWARSSEEVTGENFAELLGNGRIVLTINANKGEPYQGIVSVAGTQFADSIENYFTQSEQLKTRLWLFADEHHAAGLFIQELPSNDKPHAEENWTRIEALADTITDKELLYLPCEQVLQRLFHEEALRLFEAESVAFKCRCSQEKIETTLLALGKNEVEQIIKEQGEIIADCEFCSRQYQFDNIDIERIFSAQGINNTSNTQH